MKTIFANLFKRRAEPARAPEAAPQQTPSQPPAKRKLNGKRKRPIPKGARRIDPDKPILQQVRGKQ